MSTIIIITPKPKKPQSQSERRVETDDSKSIADQLREAADIIEGEKK